MKQDCTTVTNKVFLDIQLHNRIITIRVVNLRLNNKKDLFTKAQMFFNTHSNPFILDIRVVFSILEASNFKCIVENNL